MPFSAKSNPRYSRLVYIGFAAAVSILYDIFFWKQEKGLNFLLFVLLYIAGFAVISYASKQFHLKPALWLLIPLLVFSGDVLTFNNDWVQYGVPWIVFLLLLFFSLLLPLRNPEKHLFSFRHISVVKHIDLPFTKWSRIYQDLFRWKEVKGSVLYKKIAIGIILAVPIVVIFTVLFAAADTVFANSLDKIWSYFSHFTVNGALVWRIFRTFVMALWLASLFYVLWSEEHTLRSAPQKSRDIDGVIAGVVLGFVNILFAIFVFIQLKYLFGSAQFVLAHGLTFADYARHGFFELVWVAILSVLLVSGVFKWSLITGRRALLTVLCLLLLAQVAVIAVSALKRMNLYQEAYGYTVLRLYVEWFIYFLLLVLVVQAAWLVSKKTYRAFFYAVLIAGLSALAVVSSRNVDFIIAEQNIYRFLGGQQKTLDINYLSQLSSDILPALQPLVAEKNLHLFSKQEQQQLYAVRDEKVNDIHRRNHWWEWNILSSKNKYWTIPPDANYYNRRDALEKLRKSFDSLEVSFSSQEAVGYYCKPEMRPLPSISCESAQVAQRTYVLQQLSDNKNVSSSASIWRYALYQNTVLPSSIVSSTLLFEKRLANTFPNRSIDLLNNGAIVERNVENYEHYQYDLVEASAGSFSLVKSGPLEK